MPITHYTSSDGSKTALGDMAYPHLLNAIRKREKALGGGMDDMLAALRAELARRPPPSGDPNPPSHALPRAAGIGDNNPPPDGLAEALEAENKGLLDEAADLEMAAAKLPKEVSSDDDVALITAWVVRAAGIKRQAETDRKERKQPIVEAGRIIDSFFNGIGAAIETRVQALEKRKVPYLQAKRAREEAERAARAEDLRRAEREAQARIDADRAAANAARAAQDAAEQRLRDARTAEDMAAAEAEALAANREAATQQDAVDQGEKDLKRVGKAADREERILAGDHTHVLGKVSAGGGSSSLKATYRPDLHNRARFVASLGPLGPYLPERELDAALIRAAKADPRPAIPGVDWIEDVQAQTHAARA